MTNNFDYNANSDSYRFLKVPHVLLYGEKYAKMTVEAKLLYALMLDRVSLSAKHDWRDKLGQLYIYYTVKEIEKMLNCGHNKALRILDELEATCLIRRIHQRKGRPTKFYVMELC